MNGFTKEADVRLPLDRASAKQLLAEAGYPNSFEVVLDCPNNRYLNDEEICQAVTAMLAQVGIQVRLNAMPRPTYFPEIQKYDTGFCLLGWGVPAFDALYLLQSLAQTVDPKTGDGNFNLGPFLQRRVRCAGQPDQDRDRSGEVQRPDCPGAQAS